MQLRFSIPITLLLNVVVNTIGYFINEEFFSKSTIYWAIIVLVISTISIVILDFLIKTQEERDQLNDNLSRLLITKENTSKVLSLTISPKAHYDKMSINKRTNITVNINSIYDLHNKPSLYLESNLPLKVEMRGSITTSVSHAGKYIYYINEENNRNWYFSKRYFTYEMDITPLNTGEYKLNFITELSNHKSEQSYILTCK